MINNLQHIQMYQYLSYKLQIFEGEVRVDFID